MRIAVDIDDTLNILDRVGTAGAYIARNRLPFRLKNEYANMFELVYDWTREDVVTFIQSGGISAFIEARARKGASSALGGWIAEGWEVVILTARRTAWFGNPESISRDWLEKRRIPYSSLVIEERDKGRYCAQHHISVLIDDNLDNCLGAQERGVCAVLAIGKCNEARAKEIYFGSGTWSGLDKAVRRIVRVFTLQELVARACPARSVSMRDGWEYRSDIWRGRRGNCVRPVLPSLEPMEEKVERYEAECSEKGRDCRFWLTECDAYLESILIRRGYGMEWSAQCMTKPLGEIPPVDGVQISGSFEGWTKDYRTVTGDTGVLRAYAYIAGACLYATVRDGTGAVVAVGMAVFEQGALAICDVRVKENCRRSGYGTKIVAALLGEGKRLGAEYAHLQVGNDNSGAIALYGRLGFIKAYDYWFRVKRARKRGDGERKA